MKIASKNVVSKKEKAKKSFLEELKGSLQDVKKAESMVDKPFVEALSIVKKSHGGARAGAGAKKSTVRKVQRGVKLSEQQYKFIVSKYGSFASGVKSLLPPELAK